MDNIDDILREHLKKLGSKGGKKRAAKYSKAKLSEWGKLGGRPRKKASKQKVKP